MVDNKEGNTGSSVTDILSDIGEKSGEYLLKAITGVRLGDTGAKASYFPVGNNPVTISYDGSKGQPEKTHLEASLGVGGSAKPHIADFVLTKQQGVIHDDGSGIYSVREVGLLAGRGLYSSSLLGGANLSAGPQLSNAPSVEMSTSGGIGVHHRQTKYNGDGQSVTWDIQAAAKAKSDVVESVETSAPRVAISVATSGKMEDKSGRYALGLTAFLEHGKPVVALAGKRQWNNDVTTVNVSAEAVASQIRQMIKASAEVSGPVNVTPDMSITPYASVSVTKIQGSGVSDCMASGVLPALNVGVAKEWGPINFFVQQHTESGQKPSVEVGMMVGDMTAARPSKKCR